MRKFFYFFHKSAVLTYFVCLLFLFYGSFMEQIPDEIFVERGDSLDGILMKGLSLRENSTDREFSTLTFGDIKSNTVTSFIEDGNVSGQTMGCYLWGVFPIKDVHVQLVEGESVFASGRLVGIYEQMKGVLVLDSVSFENQNGEVVEPAKGAIRGGDYITAVDGQEVNSKEDIVKLVDSAKGEYMRFSILRGNEESEVLIQPQKSSEGSYLAGIWIKDDLAGIGTMTYYTIDKEFGALGHGIGDGVTENLLSVHDGDLYNMSLQRIDRGMAGKPGQVAGTIYFGSKSHIGHLDNNLNIGIYGTLDDEDYTAYSETDHLYEAAHKQDIEIGSAQIISEVSGELKTYDVKITEVDLGTKDENKGIVLQITDDELIELTGGIIQGMSGSPIIQNGRIIGAVTHVFVNDPTQGYGIFIENMLER